ncbi:hypothetical protein B0J12DRAFT_704302 [Macrophomina phaseolina]|uniref:Uncharacterized protein n=1 Tax=Macrophomina phaseolina TaxID=35725 RepID=A0ABQ8FVY3_9PEZI|nr:hypothetical protein B0J12DRAFT_704302 [Macrophomina phaseolina]
MAEAVVLMETPSMSGSICGWTTAPSRPDLLHLLSDVSSHHAMGAEAGESLRNNSPCSLFDLPIHTSRILTPHQHRRRHCPPSSPSAAPLAAPCTPHPRTASAPAASGTASPFPLLVSLLLREMMITYTYSSCHAFSGPGGGGSRSWLVRAKHAANYSPLFLALPVDTDDDDDDDAGGCKINAPRTTEGFSEVLLALKGEGAAAAVRGLRRGPFGRGSFVRGAEDG